MRMKNWRRRVKGPEFGTEKFGLYSEPIENTEFIAKGKTMNRV